MNERVFNKYESVFVKAVWVLQRYCWRLRYFGLNRYIFDFGTRVLLELDFFYFQYRLVFIWSFVMCKQGTFKFISGDRFYLFVEGVGSGRALCVFRVYGVCCQRRIDSVKDWYWYVFLLSFWLFLRVRLRNLCFFCCVIKLFFVFQVFGFVRIQVILVKILGFCFFELEGQLWRNFVFFAGWLIAVDSFQLGCY